MASVQLADVLTERLPLIVSAVLVLGVTVIVQVFFSKDPLANFPFNGSGSEEERRQQLMKNAKKTYLEGYRMNKVHKVASTRNNKVLSIPPQFLEELKQLPDDTISFSDAVADLMAGKYTGINSVEGLTIHTIRNNLTPALPKINPILTEEVTEALRKELGPLPDWTEITINTKLLRVVAIVSGRIFLGAELCHDEKYIEAAIMYTIDLVGATRALFALRPWQRPFRAPFMKELKDLKRHETEFMRMIEPIVRERRAARAKDPNYVVPDDMLGWLEGGAEKKHEQRSTRELAKLQLGLSFAAIHTTTLTLMHIMFDLAAYPDIIPQLREEAEAALAVGGGVFTTPALHSMKKMDSVMKESQRMSPPGYSSFMRKVKKTFTLSNGQEIPAGASIEVPSYGVSHDSVTFRDPDSFDGLRFYRLREAGETFNQARDGKTATAAEVSAQNQFASVSKNSLAFGYGRHACPGRFFAANEVKMILARIMLDYDFKLAGGETERYPNLESAGAIIPDPTRKLLFKQRF